MIAVLMGVAGAGKTTVGRAVAERLQWRFVDADDLHPASNIDKMARGMPLDDTDRQPWLEEVHEVMEAAAARNEGLMVACSALREQYRRQLARGIPDLRWIYLRADRALLHQRLAARYGHFAGPALLETQLKTLEPPREAVVVDAAKPTPVLVDEICAALTRGAAS